MPDNWCLIFSDGTGQRGVAVDSRTYEEGIEIRGNTNIYQMYEASQGKPYLDAFYDPGLGAPEEGDWDWSRTLRNLWSKGTGWGITANIVDCYEAVVERWRPGVKIGFFGFSRGAFTVRCLGGVLATCGIARSDGGVAIPADKEGPGARRRRKIAEEAVAAYKIKDAAERKRAGADFAAKYQAEPAVPDVVGVFDTVRSLGLPGVMNIVNPWKHDFHDNRLSSKIRLGLHALAVDENRKAFLPEPWEDVDEAGRAAGQRIEQVWFPGVHSDVGGGYEDDRRLADLSLSWMLGRLRDVARLHIPLTVAGAPNPLGKAHDERTGFGVFWLPAERSIRSENRDVDALCEWIEDRFEQHRPIYRPKPLAKHPRVEHYF